MMVRLHQIAPIGCAFFVLPSFGASGRVERILKLMANALLSFEVFGGGS
jgi:hypothetical protein